MTTRVLTGAAELCRIVAVMGNCRGDFLDQFTIEQLVQIFRVHQRCEWDYYPDQWSHDQVQGALLGIVPRFDDNGAPL